jgi:hypothetical protein
MRRLLRFFVLMTLRVVAVTTLILWGSSRVQHIRVLVPIASMAATLQTYSDGYCLAIIFKPNAPLRLDVLGGKSTSLAETFHDWQSFGGAPFWVGTESQAAFIAGAYWLVLFLTVLLYGMIEYRGRRRKRESAT